MNNVTPERKESLLKTLAIIGLFGVIILIAWISVQIVSVFPNAINSLASLAESVYSFDPKAADTVTLKSVSGPIITNNEFTVAWEEPKKKGNYVFSYGCQDGLSIQVKTTQSDFLTTECESQYDLGAVESAKLIVNSEKKSVVDLVYTISYFKNNSSSSTAQQSQTVTILNPRLAPAPKEEVLAVNATSTEEVATTTIAEVLPSTETLATTTKTEVAVVTPKPEVEIPKTTPKDEPTKPVTPTKPVAVKPAPVYEYEYTYAIPTSDPKGFVDLEVTYLGLGKTYNGVFVNTGILNKNSEGAMQFAVKNIGTKTSEDWYFTAKLPGDINYESAKQLALKPNEKSILTINFPSVNESRLYTYNLSAKTINDINSKNNQAVWSVMVIK